MSIAEGYLSVGTGGNSGFPGERRTHQARCLRSDSQHGFLGRECNVVPRVNLRIDVSLVLATASPSLGDVINGGVPRTMGRTLGNTHSLSTHSHGIRRIPGEDVEASRILPWQRELRNSPDLRTDANVKTARVVLKGATSRI